MLSPSFRPRQQNLWVDSADEAIIKNANYLGARPNYGHNARKTSASANYVFRPDVPLTEPVDVA